MIKDYIRKVPTAQSLKRTSDSALLRMNLNFLNDDMEISYHEFLEEFHQRNLRLVLLAAWFTSLINWIMILVLGDFSEFGLIINLLNLVLLSLALLFILKRKDLKYANLITMIVILYIIVLFVELSNISENDFKSKSKPLLALEIEFFLAMPLVFKIFWRNTTLLNITANVYLVLRFNIDHNLDGLQCIVFAFNILVISITAYSQEKYDRQLHSQHKNDQNSLNQLQHLIKRVIPSAILIFRNGEVTFYNQELCKLLNVRFGARVEEKLSRVFIKENSKEKDVFNSKSNLDDRLFSRIVSDSPTFIGDLYKLLLNVKEDGHFLCGFESFRGVLKDSSPGQSVEKNLELKMCKIAWEGSEGMIVILSEDLMTQHMNYLNEQARYKDKLLATVSHDLRTPLNGVIGILDLALESVQEAGLRKSLLLALRSSKLLLYMINDILDFTQITNGKLRLNPTEFKIEDVIHDVSKLIKFQAKQKGVDFQYENKFEKQQQVKFHSDPNRLKQIILNLLGNALKFTEKGFIKISIEPVLTENDTSSFQKSASAVKFTVQDSGCGIKAQDLPRLFQLFGKLETSDSQRINQTGIGLGLAISQHLVRLLNDNIPGEEIKVTSEWGNGSLFHFVLYPMGSERENKGAEEDVYDEGFLKVEEPMVTEYRSLLKIDKSEAEKKRVLLVDDDQINILVLTKYFSTFPDCVYDIAFHGLKAIELVRNKARENLFYDIIFMDCNMPVMDGFEATRHIIEMVKLQEIPPVPIIASTANASPLDYENCFKNGMVDYVSKPFVRAQLRSKLDSCLAKYK